MTDKNDPDILWHYTTFEAMTKIVQTGKLLASNFQTLNDKSEMQTGYELCIEWMRQHSNEDVRSLSDDTTFLAAIGSGNWPYVISLSDAKDSLSMWRGYGDAVNGNTGIAIGFSKQDLVDLQGGQFFEGPSMCVYNQENFFSDLDKIVENLDNNAPMFAIYGDLIKCIPRGKNHHFIEEREWRMLAYVFDGHDDQHLEEINGSFRFPFDINAYHVDSTRIAERPMGIVEIMAGPKTELSKLKLFSDIAFRKKGLDTPLLTKSEIPFV